MATLGYLMARLMSALALSLKANGLHDEDPSTPARWPLPLQSRQSFQAIFVCNCPILQIANSDSCTQLHLKMQFASDEVENMHFCARLRDARENA